MLRALLLAVALTVVVAAPAAAQDPFTVTAPDGAVYGATTEELDHWTEIARRGNAGRQSRTQAFQLLAGFAWVRGEAAERGIEVTHASDATCGSSSPGSAARRWRPSESCWPERPGTR